MRAVSVFLVVATTGCLPRPEPAAPYAGAAATASSGPGATVGQAPVTPQPYPAANAPQPAQPYPAPTAQPYPAANAPQPAQPYPAPSAQPYPAPSAQPYPAPAAQPYPAANAPQPAQPYPAQPYPAQPYPAPTAQPYPAPAYPAPSIAGVASRSSRASAEIIADFASVGALASIDLIVRQDIENGSAGTLLVLAGLTGGGATGWLLSQKYPVDRGTARATTLGLMVGAANGALLIEPTEGTEPDQVLGLLLLGSAVGTVGGFAYGQSTKLTSGQSTFVGNLALLGSATAAFTAIAGSRDGSFGGWENSTLALGLDAGVLGGALIAPSLDWSPRRSNIVFASTAIGAFLGGMLVGLVTKPEEGDSANGDLVAGCMTAGMWGGFGLGILMTNESPPDARFRRPSAGMGATVTPFLGDRGELGMMAGGTW